MIRRWSVPRANGARRGSRSGEEGSMVMAMMAIIVTTFLAVSMFPLLLAHLRSTQADSGQAGSLAVADGGLSAGVASIRAAGSNLGVMPCTLSGTLPGSSQHYSVQITYTNFVPTGKSAQELMADASNGIVCTTGPASMPSFALLVSTGSASDSSGSQTVSATYTFNRAYNLNSGGQIHIGDSAAVATAFCLDAGVNPVAGSVPVVATCASTPSQMWAYGVNQTLSLPASVSSNYPYGLCITAAFPHKQERAALAPCSAQTSFAEQFSYTSDQQFHSTATSGTASEPAYCLQIGGTPAPGGVLLLDDCTSPQSTLLPDSGIGVGAGGARVGQLVNYGRFNRCLTVPGSSATASYLSASVCAQPYSPWAPFDVSANQVWSAPALSTDASAVVGHITVTLKAATYCLTSNGLNNYPTLSACGSANTQNWRVFGASSSVGGDYRILDYQNRCLAITDPAAPTPDLEVGTKNSKAVVTNCAGLPVSSGLLQRWNAPPQLVSGAGVSDVLVK